MEQYVAGILEKMVAAGSLTGFIQYAPPNSPEDCQGKDFSVFRGEDERSFGISINARKARESALMHQSTPQWYFPIGIKEDTIERKALGLFEAD